MNDFIDRLNDIVICNYFFWGISKKRLFTKESAWSLLIINLTTYVMLSRRIVYWVLNSLIMS